MLILDRRHVLSLAAGAAGATFLPTEASAGLGSADVYTASPEGGQVDSVVILGDEAAVLVDAQLTAPDAAALADLISATGRRLETVVLSHMHPDHVLGLAVIMDRFPEARPVAHPLIQPQIEASAAAMLDGFNANAPAGVFADRAVIPEALNSDQIELEGERIEIMDPMHGDTDLISPVYVPALGTLIAADLLYQDIHVWVAENTTPERIALWRENLSKLEALNADTVIPGHRAPDSGDGAGAFAWTRGYLDIWEAALVDTSTPEELRATMMEGREGLGLALAVERAVGAVYPEG